MKYMIVVLLAVAVAVQAQPFLDGMGGEMGLGYGYGSGRGYGQSGYGGGRNGYMNQGYGNNMLHSGHAIENAQNDYDSTVHHHQSDTNNIGGMTQSNGGGHSMGGYDGYNRAHNMFGNGYRNGFY